MANYDFVYLRAALKSIHMHSKVDLVRGSFRWSLGLAELMTNKTRFGNPIQDPGTGWVYPRVSQIQLDGKLGASVVLDGVMRLLTLIFKCFESFDFVQELRNKLSPVRFPLLVNGSRVFRPTPYRQEQYELAASLMSRCSITLFEGSSANKESHKVRTTIFQPKSAKCCDEKFDQSSSVNFHIDSRDIDCVQVVAVVAHKMPEEVFMVIDEVDNQSIMYYDIGESEDDDIKLYVFGCNFRSMVHGNIRLNEAYNEFCTEDSWMVRISPYGTEHAARWSERLQSLSLAEQRQLLKQFYCF